MVRAAAGSSVPNWRWRAYTGPSHAGVEVEARREAGLVHNFMILDDVSPACVAAADRVADDIRARLSAPNPDGPPIGATSK